MSRINVLDAKTANAIKAGEVIERPVSVVKELVDNSIDAGASSVKIEFDNGGISLIKVSDNGIGMDIEDAHKCFLIHATSKITSVEDIYDLSIEEIREKVKDEEIKLGLYYVYCLVSEDSITEKDIIINNHCVNNDDLFANDLEEDKFFFSWGVLFPELINFCSLFI